jgi:hypothetical protein
MTNLAIRGNINNRGLEVIKTLEMLGGVNKFNLDGNTDAWYVLDEGRTIRWCEWIFEEKGFTLEEFLEEFPYKVGDRVRVPEYESEVCISKMYWDGNEVQYEVVTDEVEWYSAKELNKFNEPNQSNNTNKEKKINQMSLANSDLDEVEIVLGDNFELKIREGKYYAIRKKILYPKTFEECCKVLGCKADDFFTSFSYKGCDVVISEYEDKVDDLLQNFRKLRYARDAYWKIAGEQMGLGEPWEPDWSTESEIKYVIEVYRNKVRTNSHGYPNTILAFPTAEMRDAFLENFGYLIELCKELL